MLLLVEKLFPGQTLHSLCDTRGATRDERDVSMAVLLQSVGQFAARRAWLVILAWLAILGAAGGAYSLFGGPFATSLTIPGTPTSQVQDQLEDKFPTASGDSGTIVVETLNGAAFTPDQKAAVQDLLQGFADLPGVKTVTDGFTGQDRLDQQRQDVTDARAQLEDGRTQLAQAQTQLDPQSEQLRAAAEQLVKAQQDLDAQRAQAEADGTASSPDVQDRLTQAQAEIDTQRQQITAGQDQVSSAQNELDTTAASLAENQQKLDDAAALLDLSAHVRLVSDNGSAAIGTVQFADTIENTPLSTRDTIADRAADAHIDGVAIYVSNDIARVIPAVFGPGEIVGLIVAAIALLVMLRTLVGAAVPLMSAMLGVGVATLAALSFSGTVEFTAATPVLGLMLGLAVGIDYSLFILNRHRTHLKQGMGVQESLGLANGTSGNAVVFAGSTVIVALLALNITGIPFLGLMGTVGAAAVLVAILLATTFTPAVLSLLGPRILAKKERQRVGQSGQVDPPNTVMSTRRAVVTLIAGVSALGVLAFPVTQMRLGLPTGASEATHTAQYKAYTAIAEQFGPGRNGPLLVVATLPDTIAEDEVTATEVTIGRAIAENDDVAAVLPLGASDDRTIVAFQVVPAEGPDSISTEDLVTGLRAQTVATEDGGVTLGVAGNASANIDISARLANALPAYLTVVIGLSLLILMVVFRSVLVPVTATAGFILSVLASFGGITAIYQWGWLGAVFGVHDPAPILSFLPTIQIGILFGLAMDYQLFLVTGMREAHAHGAPARIAVHRGLHAGRAVVTAAAIIMISVFAGFIFSESSTIKPIGFGLAFGVLLDAFIVRMLLIPAIMHLLGAKAWWLPRGLDRILPDIDIEGTRLQRTEPEPSPTYEHEREFSHRSVDASAQAR